MATGTQRGFRALHSAFDVAEEVGFEPTGSRLPAVFKTAAINHSATPPLFTISCCTNRYKIWQRRVDHGW